MIPIKYSTEWRLKKFLIYFQVYEFSVSESVAPSSIIGKVSVRDGDGDESIKDDFMSLHQPEVSLGIINFSPVSHLKFGQLTNLMVKSGAYDVTSIIK